MTPEAQQIAIGEALGQLVFSAKAELYGSIPPWEEQIAALPDYLSDLNAMHEAEAALFDTHESMGCAVYREWLLKLTADGAGQNHFHALRATAAQRAEAFLRTLGKWTE